VIDLRIDFLKINYFNFLMQKRRLLEKRCLLNCFIIKDIDDKIIKVNKKEIKVKYGKF
jgi:hypothetical protein